MNNDIGKWRFIDLFSGIGGFRVGFQRAGFKPVYSNDFDKWCKLTYETNFGIDTLDQRPIEDVSSSEIPESEIILAGFPCQPFSMAGKQKGFKDKRGHAFFELARIIRDKKPKVIILENVKHIISHDKKRTFEIIKHTLENDLGYHMYYKILNAKDYGLPQDRKRIYMVGFKDDVRYAFPSSLTNETAIRDILEKNVSDDYFLSEKYLEGLEKHKKRHQARGQGFGFEVLDRDGIAHALVVGNMGRERNLIQDKPRKHFYREGDDKSVKKNNKGIRKLTERECARLQGFPDTFKCPVCRTKAYAQFGNAVAVPVVQAVAMSVKKALRDHYR